MFHRIRIYLVIFTLALLALALSLARAKPVAAEGPCHVPVAYATIQAAVDDPTCSDIRVAAGVYAENVLIQRDVNIAGDVRGETIVDGGGIATAVHIDGPLTVSLSHLIIQNGNATVQPYSGGGIAARDAYLTVHRSTIRNNTVLVTGGGIWSANGSLTVTESTITGNRADYGAGLIAGNRLLVHRSTISENIAVVSGGGVSFLGSDPHHVGQISESIIRDNRATHGGGVVIANSTAHLLIHKTKILRNQAYEHGGGVINVFGATVTLRQSRVTHNTADLLGNDLFNYRDSTVIIEQSRVDDIYNEGTIIR